MYSEEQNATASRPFRVCQACGQLTPSNEAQCAYCGAISPQAVQEQEEHRFFHSVFSRATPITYGLLVINVLYYFVVAAYGLESATFIAFGAKTNALLREGDWFRLVTPIFIHGGLIHLFLNSYVLWANGPLVEKLYGPARFLLIYLLSGIGGVVGSYVWQKMAHNSDAPSVGASGALFGLFGLLAVFGFKYKEVPASFQKALRSSVMPAIVINLIIGFSVPFIDNGGHIGGLIVGSALAFVVPYLPPGTGRRAASSLAILLACVLVIALSFAAALRQTTTHLHWREADINRFLNSFNQAQNSLAEIENGLNTPPATGANKENLTQLGNAIAALETAVGPDQKSDSMRKGLLTAVQKQRQLMQDGASSKDIEQNFDRCVEEFKRYSEWFKTEGASQAARHGLKLTSQSQK